MLKIENPVKRKIAEILNFLILILLFPFILKKNKFPSKVKKILILRPDHIGDVVMSTSIYKAIKKKFPECKLSVMVGEWGKEVLLGNPYINEIIIHNCPWWKKVRNEKAGYLKWLFKDLPEIIKKIKKEKFDIGIDLRGDFRHILFFLFLGRVKYKISYARSGGEYLLEKAVNYELNLHEIEKNFRLLKEIGIEELTFEEKRPEIFLGNEEKKKTEDILKKIEQEKIKVAIHPSAGNKLRMWRKENFIKIIDWLKNEFECEVYLVGKEKNLGDEIENFLKENVKNFMGKLSLRETSVLIKNCDFFIGNDSSLAHIAACFDIPILILYGPNNPDRCKPYSPYFHYIYHKLSCSPCLQIKCSKMIENVPECMERIKVEEVKEKIKEIFKSFE